jgi:hypothetical protein
VTLPLRFARFLPPSHSQENHIIMEPNDFGCASWDNNWVTRDPIPGLDAVRIGHFGFRQSQLGYFAPDHGNGGW